MAMALPKHLTVDRMLRTAFTAMNKVPKLQQASEASFCSAMLQLSALGLEPDGRLAHLIPFNNTATGGVDVQVITDYKGLVHLAMQSGQVQSIHADVVCEKDEFTYETGRVRHVPNLREDRGEVFAVYVVIKMNNSYKVEVMTVKEVEAIRSRSRSGKSGPWVTDWREMAKKTVFKRAAKWIPLSPEIRDVLAKEDDEDFPQRKVTIPQLTDATIDAEEAT